MKNVKKLSFLVVFMVMTMIFCNMSFAAAQKYLIVDVFDHYDDNCSAIHEIELFDSSSNKINYTIPSNAAYDSASNGIPSYWNSTGVWDQTRLYDGNHTYDSTHSNVVNWVSNPNTGKWSRFAIAIDSSKTVSKINVWTGQARIPKKVSVYTTDSYDYSSNIKGRDNKNLSLFGECPIKSTTAIVANEIKTTDSAVTLEVTSVDKAKVHDLITANVVIHNATNICAEDIKLSYDTSRLEFVSAEGSNGIKIYKEADISVRIKRYITASLGKANAANGDKILLKLTFKAKATGEAKIDITNGRIADNATLEMDVEEANCGEKTILIEGTKDVNRSGAYTLLDLGIDAWYYGDSVANTDKSKYDTDVIENGSVDDADLSKIVEEMLSNPNYSTAIAKN